MPSIKDVTTLEGEGLADWGHLRNSDVLFREVSWIGDGGNMWEGWGENGEKVVTSFMDGPLLSNCEPPTTLDLRGIKAFSNYYCIYCVHKLSNPAISLWKHRGLRTRVKSCHSTLPFSLKCPHATLLPKKTQRNRFMTISSSVFVKPYIICKSYYIQVFLWYHCFEK